MYRNLIQGLVYICTSQEKLQTLNTDWYYKITNSVVVRHLGLTVVTIAVTDDHNTSAAAAAWTGNQSTGPGLLRCTEGTNVGQS